VVIRANRVDGPAGLRGLRIVDIPFDSAKLEVDSRPFFASLARQVRPKLVTLGALHDPVFPIQLRQ